MFSNTKLNSFIPRGEKGTQNHSQLSFLLLNLCFLIANVVANGTIAKIFLKLLTDLMINVTRGEGKQVIGKIPSFNGAVGCHIISVQRGIVIFL